MGTTRKLLILLGVLLAAFVWWSLRATPLQTPAAPIGAPTTSPEVDSPQAHLPSSRIRVPPALRGIQIRVSDANDNPIGNATVQTFSDSVPGQQVTDTAGTCQLPIRELGRTARILIHADGFHHWHKQTELGPQLHVRLRPARPVVGNVIDRHTGKPIEGAIVSWPHRDCDGCDAVECTTDKAGRFEFRATPVGQSMTLVVRAPSYPVHHLPLRIEVVREQTRFDIAIDRGTELHGMVVDRVTGAPVAQVAIAETTGHETLAQTDASGRFAVPLLPGKDGRLAVELTARGYCRIRCSFATDEAAPGNLLTIPYPRSTPITGTVRDSYGNAIVGAVVTAHESRALSQRRAPDGTKTPLGDLPAGWRFRPEQPTTRAATDATGTFRTTGVVPWSTIARVTAAHPDHRITSQRIGQVGGPAEPHTVSFALAPLGPTGTVTGVLRLNGLPAEGTVQWKGTTRHGSARAGPSGEFRLLAEAGPVELDVLIPNFGGFEQVPHFVNVHSDGTHATSLEVTIPMGTVSGRVTDDNNTPLHQQRVYARAGSNRHVAATDGDGSYSIPVPLERRYTITMFAGGETHARADIQANSSGVDFTIPRSGIVRYRLFDRNTDTPVPRFQLAWHNLDNGKIGGGGPNLARQGTADGWHERKLPIGRYRLEFRATDAGYLPARSLEFLVTQATPAEVSIGMWKGVAIRLRLPPGHAPLPPDCTVLLLHTDVWADIERETSDTGHTRWHTGANFAADAIYERMVRFGRSGTIELRGLRPGRHRFKVFGADIEITPEFVDARSLVPELIDVHWRAKQ